MQVEAPCLQISFKQHLHLDSSDPRSHARRAAIQRCTPECSRGRKPGGKVTANAETQSRHPSFSGLRQRSTVDVPVRSRTNRLLMQGTQTACKAPATARSHGAY